jgi:hypothetical protein
MVTLDVVRQGYPSLEAARAALQVCDELVIADGWSTDGTWEALNLPARGIPGPRAAFQRCVAPRREPRPSAA